MVFARPLDPLSSEFAVPQRLKMRMECLMEYGNFLIQISPDPNVNSRLKTEIWSFDVWSREKKLVPTQNPIFFIILYKNHCTFSVPT